MSNSMPTKPASNNHVAKRMYEDGDSDAMRASHCRDTRGPCICEHCDGERSSMVRYDSLRGWICKICDSSLDEMYEMYETSSDGHE